MIINHNMNAMNAHRSMSTNTVNSGKSMEKLSSGLRINRAGDDAAGLAISEKMRGQIRGLDQASRNSQDGISLIQTAEGALAETHSILQRMRELGVQSANDTTTDADRANIQKEVNQLSDEINRIGNTTEFNTIKLINGNVSTNIAEGAKLVGGDLGSSVTLISAATKGTATGGAITGAVNIHGDTSGKLTGSLDLSNAANNNITASNNELTFTVDGVEKTIVLDVVDYADTAAGAQLLVDNINAKLTAGTIAATASLGAGNKLVLTSNSTGANSKIAVSGGNAVGTIVGTGTAENGTVANDTLTFNVDGVAKSITLTQAVYNTPADLVTQINTKLTAGTIAATAKLDGNALVLESNGTGSTSSITNIDGTASADLKLFGSTSVVGKDVNNQFEINIDGTTATITVAAATYTDMDVYAAAVQSAINNNATISAAGKQVSVENSNGNLAITDSKTGSTSSLTITDGTGATAALRAGAAALGFTNTTATNTSDTGISGTDQALKMQIGANKGQEMAVAINDMRAAALGITSTSSSKSGVTAQDGSTLDVAYGSSSKVTNGSTTEYVINVSTHDAAKNAISVIDNAIAQVSTERSNLGAYQNRLEHTIANLGTSSENLTSAESRIRDVDMAKEMMTFSKNNILSQAAQAMLAQANQQPQGVLQLLR